MKSFGIAIIGASNRSTMLLNYLKKFSSVAQLTGVFDIIPERSEYLLNHYNQSQAVVYDSLDAAINDPATDAVFIGTGDNQHVEPCVKALEAGKHVYCEKPMAITMEDCDIIIDAAKTSKAVFYLGMNLRHGPMHEKMHELITSGTLGKILTIEANEYYYGGRTYFRRWNRLREHGGGLWITKACHDFDLLNWMADSPVKRVWACSSLSHYKNRPEGGTECRSCPIKKTCEDFYDIENPADIRQDKLLALTEKVTGQMRDICLYNSDKDTFDNGIAVVEYENDIRATYTVNVVSGRSTRQIRVLGTKASAEGDMEAASLKVWPRHGGSPYTFDLSATTAASSHGGADDKILKDFFRCCETLEKPRSSWMDGRTGIQTALAARESCDTNCPVAIEQT